MTQSRIKRAQGLLASHLLLKAANYVLNYGSGNYETHKALIMLAETELEELGFWGKSPNWEAIIDKQRRAVLILK